MLCRESGHEVVIARWRVKLRLLDKYCTAGWLVLLRRPPITMTFLNGDDRDRNAPSQTQYAKQQKKRVAFLMNRQEESIDFSPEYRE